MYDWDRTQKPVFFSLCLIKVISFFSWVFPNQQLMKSSFWCYNKPASFQIHPLLSEPWGRWWQWGSWRWRIRWWCLWRVTWWGTCPAPTPSWEAPPSGGPPGGHSTSHWNPSPCSSRGSRQGSLASGGALCKDWVGSGSGRLRHQIQCHMNLELILCYFQFLDNIFSSNFDNIFNFLLCHLGCGGGGVG